MDSILSPGYCYLSKLRSVSVAELDSFPGHATGDAQHVHGDDQHVGVVHSILLGVELELVVLKGSGLLDVVLNEVLDDLEPPGVLWVR